MDSELNKVLNHNVDSFIDSAQDITSTSVDKFIDSGSFDDYGFSDDDRNETEKNNTIVSYNCSKNYFVKIRELLGYIISVDYAEKTFKTLFRDSYSIEREIDFSFEDVQKEDWIKIQVNQSIIFIYGKQIDHGTEYNTSKIYFRKSKRWTSAELKAKQRKAESLFDFFNKDENK